MTAEAADGSTFTGWPLTSCSPTGSCDVTLDTDRRVEVTFSAEGTAPDDTTLTVEVQSRLNGAGIVTSEPPGISCPAECVHEFPAGRQVTLTAAPNESSGFDGWSGEDCTGTGNCVVTLDESRAVTGTFGKEPVE